MLEFLINTKLFPLPSSLEAFTQPNPAPQVEMPGLAAGAGHTPLHLAAIRGHMDIVTSLVDAGVNVNITNRLGQTVRSGGAANSWNFIPRLAQFVVCLS